MEVRERERELHLGDVEDWFIVCGYERLYELQWKTEKKKRRRKKNYYRLARYFF